MKQIKESGKPVVLTVNGKAAVVVQDAEAYQRLMAIAEKAEMMEFLPETKADADAGHSVAAREFLQSLGRKKKADKASAATSSLPARLEEEELTDLLQAKDVLAKVVRWYNEERLHRALGYLPPVVYYRGDPKTRHEERRRKLADARHRRKETNLKLTQRTIPFAAGEPASST